MRMTLIFSMTSHVSIEFSYLHYVPTQTFKMTSHYSASASDSLFFQYVLTIPVLLRVRIMVRYITPPAPTVQ